MTFGSLFAGVGGFDLGFERAGMTCSWQVELDSWCQSVLERHWPDVRRHDDIRTFPPKGESPKVDVICGGWPCQNLSKAGRREGLFGDRSRLFFELLRVAKLLRPLWVVWENVPGLLSSDDGRDFARVLRGLADIGYFGGWRVLDAQHFGVAQRRRRVYGVFTRGHLGAIGCGEVLSLSQGLRRHQSSSSESGEGVAGTLTASPGRRYERGALTARCQTTRGQRNNFDDTYVVEGESIRRLTPTEFERLMGFPDGWTAKTADGKQIADGHRYKMCGNGVVPNVAEWIGRRLMEEAA